MKGYYYLFVILYQKKDFYAKKFFQKCFWYNIYMKKLYIFISIVIFVFLYFGLIALINQNKTNSDFSRERLEQLIKTYGFDSPVVSEYFDKHKITEELRKKFIVIKNENNLKEKIKEVCHLNLENKKEKNTYSNTDSYNQIVDKFSSEKTKNLTENLINNKKSINSTNNLQSSQGTPNNILSCSNDFVVILDNNINGLNIDASGNFARVSEGLLNSDLFENESFSNTHGIWIKGLDKYKNPNLFNSLWGDYQDRLIEIPGFGYYLLRESVVPDSDVFVKLKISALKQALENSQIPKEELYQKLAKTYAEDAGEIENAINVIEKYGKDKIDYDYQIAEIYRFASENTKNENKKLKYLNDAAEHYTLLIDTSNNSDVKQWSGLRLGEIYGELGDTEKAISILEKTYWNMSEKSVPLCKHTIAYNLGNYHLKEKNYDSAIYWYDNMIIDQTFKNRRKAEVYKQKGDYYSAINCYESVASSDKEDVYSLSQAAMLFAKSGDDYEAQKAYSKIQKRIKKYTKKRRKKTLNSWYYKELKNLFQ